MDSFQLFSSKVQRGEPLILPEALSLWHYAPLSGLMSMADFVRRELHPDSVVSWQIDRNVNITNICFVHCRFCAFCRQKDESDAYITSKEEYKIKVEELNKAGGNQLLLQGGMHPGLGLAFYTDLFSWLKNEYPTIRLHALGPPEIVYLAKKEKLSYKTVLEELVKSGLDSLPGAGAEVLSDRVRSELSKGKCTSVEWLDVMREAHRMCLVTSATMMFGHIETIEERISHLILLRDLQNEKPKGSPGFLSFIPWPVQWENPPALSVKRVSATEYVRWIALSRILLTNIPNIQASLLTVGKDVAQLSLHAGANDLGSIMIEENVVSSAGGGTRVNADEMKKVIRDAGFEPVLRNQRFERLS